MDVFHCLLLIRNPFTVHHIDCMTLETSRYKPFIRQLQQLLSELSYSAGTCMQCGAQSEPPGLSGVKHKLRCGGELRVWAGIADSGEDYGVGGNYTCGKEL